ncbi:MAG: hypothetical protein CMN98_10885 [Synechococcus sp. NP17]|nr:hypothetical protein [Synechococcus sp. NP17]
MSGRLERSIKRLIPKMRLVQGNCGKSSELASDTDHLEAGEHNTLPNRSRHFESATGFSGSLQGMIRVWRADL